MHTCFQQVFKQSSRDYLVKHIQLARSKEGLQPMEWGAYLLVASKESEVQFLDITTCTSTQSLVQSHECEVSGKTTAGRSTVARHMVLICIMNVQTGMMQLSSSTQDE